jgi:hypothetical protein
LALALGLIGCALSWREASLRMADSLPKAG